MNKTLQKQKKTTSRRSSPSVSILISAHVFPKDCAALVLSSEREVVLGSFSDLHRAAARPNNSGTVLH